MNKMDQIYLHSHPVLNTCTARDKQIATKAANHQGRYNTNIWGFIEYLGVLK